MAELVEEDAEVERREEHRGVGGRPGGVEDDHGPCQAAGQGRGLGERVEPGAAGLAIALERIDVELAAVAPVRVADRPHARVRVRPRQVVTRREGQAVEVAREGEQPIVHDAVEDEELLQAASSTAWRARRSRAA